MKVVDNYNNWYADDSSAGGKIEGIKIWWDTLLEQGPKYGYYPKASKTVLIVKNSEDLDLAQKVFSGTGIKIESEGERHLGAAIGSEVFKNKYVSDKVHKWCQDIKLLSSIAVEEPQAALTAYTKGICHRWTFIQRTIPGISHLFQPLEDCIRTDFIPAILGKNVSDLDRSIFAMPVRHGGLGISNPVENCNREFTASVTITKDLTDLIINQQNTLEHYNMSIQNDTIKSLKAIKEKHLFTVSKSIEDSVRDPNLKRSLQFIKEKGSGCWLTALPLKRFGYSLKVITDKIKFCHQRYIVEEYKRKSRVIKCNKCQGWGHIHRYCTKSAKCGKCAENHESNSCSITSGFKCAHCNEDHQAGSFDCAVYKEKLAKFSHDSL